MNNSSPNQTTPAGPPLILIVSCMSLRESVRVLSSLGQLNFNLVKTFSLNHYVLLLGHNCDASCMNCAKNSVLETGCHSRDQGTSKTRQAQNIDLKKCRQVSLSCLLQCHYGCGLKPCAEFWQPWCSAGKLGFKTPEILNVGRHVGGHFSDEPEE